MKLRVTDLFEFVFVAAAGFGLARWIVEAGRFEMGFRLSRNYPWIRYMLLVDPILAGVSLAGGVGLLVERLRGSTPEVWGPGRRAWSLVSLTTLFGVLSLTSVEWSRCVRMNMSPETTRYLVEEGVKEAIQSMYYRQFGLMLAVLLVLGCFVRATGRIELDGRELSGRVLAATVVVGLVVRATRDVLVLLV